MAVVEKRTPSGSLSAAPGHRRPGHRDSEHAEVPPGLALPPVVLPDPPTDQEKLSYLRRRSWVLVLCGIFSFPPLIFGQVELVGHNHWFWLYVPFMIAGALLFVLPLITDGMSRNFDYDAHQRLVADWRPVTYPSVDVFLPVCGEPEELLRNTWLHVARLRASYPGKLTVWVLDDSASGYLKRLAREHGFAYASRPNRGWFKKSGNLLYGYLISEAEFILLLDADFAPRPDLLTEALPYMDAYPDTGIVQTPQYFRISDGQTWVERGAGAVQEVFYRSIQTARVRKGGAMCVGSCAIYRRTALDETKGMALSDHSEDLHTGFNLQRLGWGIRYVPLPLATGTCPDNVYAFMNQQYRWCCGTISLIFSRTFWRSKLPLYSRLCHLSGFVYYAYTALFVFGIPALSLSILIFDPAILQIRHMLYFVPILIASGIAYPMWHRSPYRLEAWSVAIVSGWAHLFAFADELLGRRRAWQPSGVSAAKQHGRLRLWIGIVGWNAGSSVVWVGVAFWRMLTMDPANFLMLLGIGLFNLMVVSRVIIEPRAGGQT
jgi:cellulose synthase (UDP-forming)